MSSHDLVIDSCDRLALSEMEKKLQMSPLEICMKGADLLDSLTAQWDEGKGIYIANAYSLTAVHSLCPKHRSKGGSFVLQGLRYFQSIHACMEEGYRVFSAEIQPPDCTSAKKWTHENRTQIRDLLLSFDVSKFYKK